MLQWIRHAVKGFLPLGQTAQRVIPPQPSLKPMLEALEYRLVPANLLWVATDPTQTWTSTKGAWVTTATNQWATPNPNGGDTLIFDPSMQAMTPNGMESGSQQSVTDPNSNDIGNLTVASGYTGTISFQPGHYTNITGTLNLANGTLGTAAGTQGTAELVLNGSTISNWTGGTLNVILDIGKWQNTKQAGASLSINGGSNPVVLGGTLNDSGKVALSGAGIAENGSNSENGGTIRTSAYGLFNITSDASLTQQAGGAAPGTIDNKGTFEKTGGGGTSTIVNPFHNDGSTEGSGILLAGSGTLSLTNATTYQDGLSQTTLNGGNLTVATDYLILGGWLGGVGTINGNVDNGDPEGEKQGAGTVHPGLANAGGTLNIVGSYGQTSAGWMTVNSTTASGGPGRLNVQGILELDGGLAEYRDTGFTPALGMTFPFLTETGGILGDFATKQYTNNSWSSQGQNNLYFDSSFANGAYQLVVKQ